MTDDRRLALIHRLRALTVELDLLGSEFAAAHGLHTTDVRALIALLDLARAGRPATPGVLAGELGDLNSATTTALVDRLERAGLVRRGRDVTDRRRVLLSVTDDAHRLGESFFGSLIADTRRSLDDFDDDEIAAVDRFLALVDDRIRAHRAANS
ncbi:MarR family winged helix-turn-helix transcriptional regulator [Gordonia soli]|uniref:Putative MarR family transcriptional regulator n=1 Tax=Gordonia soli NBRC 108243 TaxID=1223545 RepID=M0QF72_9ACTN|nr:MarR family transcriptional regulator [Gordonia soli]GAC67255.1 putative MarR family transcriptional regulator [Gordonia soli NBRC 108243]